MAKNLNELADLLDLEERRKYLEENKNKPKLNLEDFIITKAKDTNRYDVIDPDTNKAIAHFPYYQSRIRDRDLIGLNQIQLPEHITPDYPFVEPEYQGRGLGKQMYKFLERETGKTILPDTSLSESSLPLHKSAGLGKEFGSSNYKPKIIEAIKQQLGPESTELAEKLYEGLKAKIQKEGLTGFKSIAPLLGKAGVATAGGLVALGAQAAEQAAESTESGSTPDMPEYWLEKGIRDPEEQDRLSKLSRFKQNLTTGINYNKIPSPYEKPELKKYKESVLEAEKAGTLLPNYVEQIPQDDMDIVGKSQLEALKRLRNR